MGLMTMGIALARIRYDTSRRPERFGTGIDKIIRSTIVWGNKGKLTHLQTFASSLPTRQHVKMTLTFLKI